MSREQAARHRSHRNALCIAGQLYHGKQSKERWDAVTEAYLQVEMDREEKDEAEPAPEPEAAPELDLEGGEEE